ncbi:MAG: bifunctional UDP-sugar hydrolase/5'-nucleotidase [Acidobacteriota bacterium]
MTMRRTTGLLRVAGLILSLEIGMVWGGTDSVLLLYTCDLHDHVRPGYNGRGGLPYISGFVQQTRAKRKDVLLLDAGDVMEKGDLVAFSTQSTLTYKAIGKIGYQAIAVGNHDWNYGPDFLRNCQLLMGKTRLLCANLLEEDRGLAFLPSAVFDIDGVRIGVVGLSRPDEIGWEKTIQTLREECARLEPSVHLTIAVCHMGLDESLRLAREVPEVDIFVAGHTHDELEQPVAFKETGALVVQSRHDTEHVGWLDLTVDLDARKITRTDGRLVPMDHRTVPVDRAMLQWIRETERRECPEANRRVGHSNRDLTLTETARLGAAALRQEANADLGLCSAEEIVRGIVPRGPVDLNALFRTDGQRGRRIYEVALPGRVAQAYLDSLPGAGPMPGIDRVASEAGNQRLEPDRTYRLVIPEKQWRKSLRPFLAANSGGKSSVPPPTIGPFNFVEALARYCEKVEATGAALDAHVAGLQ